MLSDYPRNCPQCKDLIRGSSKRIIRDSCGHEKCRVCLLLDVEGCRQCLETEGKGTCDANISTTENVPTQNQFTTVITYNNIHNNIQKDLKVLSKDKDTKIALCSDQRNLTEINIEKASSEKATNCKKSSQKKSKSSIKRNYKTISIPSHITVEEDPPMFLCNICNSKFRTKGHVKYHEFCLGEKKPSYSCDVCPKSFILKSQLQNHRLIHLGSRPHVCSICDKAFREAGKLKRHLVFHSDERPHVCDECGKRFKAISSLKSHRLTHTGEKKFSCKYCEMKFNSSSNLKKHMISHSDDKTHMCEQCGKKFKQKWALTVHRRSHLHLRGFSCEDCGRAFINHKDLKRHELIHLDTKIYSCSVCSVSFRRKDNLGRHIRNGHPDKGAEIIKKVIESPLNKKLPVVDNPNAINVITASPISKKNGDSDNRSVSISRTCINGPLKLAFKTSAFKRNYNINRDYTFDSNSKGETSNSTKTLKNPCEENEKPSTSESFSINRNIPPRIFPSVYSTPNLSVDEFYANRPDVIKKLKFKLPDNYPSRSEELLKTIIPQTHISSKKEAIRTNENEALDRNILNNMHLTDNKSDNRNIINVVTHSLKPVAATSVIVNSSDQKNIHWRRRMSQNIALEKS